MNRRSFLKRGAAAALALAASPAWIRRAFADESCAAPPAVLAALAGAYRRAARAGKPLLVLIVPEELEAGWDRGAAFGEWLNHGSDAELAPLTQVEVACAPMAVSRRLVPSAGGGEPLMLLVDTMRVPAGVRRLDAPLPQYRADRSWRDGERGDGAGGEGAIADARIDTLARLLAAAVGPLPGDAPSLAREARARWVARPIPGSRWARSSGCGTVVEGVNDDSMFGCGMGHVPAKSQRFLTFFTRAGVLP